MEDRGWKIVCCVFLVICSACGSQELKAVAIEPGEMCTFCKMAISQKRFAAEFINKDGEVFKFDEIGCMARYLKQHPQTPAVYFVADSDSGEWLEGNRATYVHSSEFETPMSGGIIAFRDRGSAEKAAVKFNGVVCNAGVSPAACKRNE